MNALPVAPLVTVTMLTLSAPAATLYWDTDGSVVANNHSTGANLGGSGIWSLTNANWWNPSLGALQPWIEESDAVFWGAGALTVSTVSANTLSFKSGGYSLSSGVLTVNGPLCAFNVDSGVVATVSSAIAGTNTIWKLGPGTLILANTNNLNTANTVAGGWGIEGGGILRIMGDGSLGAPLPDTARNTVTDIQLNQSTIQAGASFIVSQNRRTKINTNASTNRGDGIIDVNENVLSWFGSLQGGPGSLRVISSTGNGGMLILGTDKIASVNPFGSVLSAGTVNLTIQDRVVVQTSGQVTPTGGELGSETNISGAVLAIKLEGGGQIRSESGGYTFLRNLILGPGGGSLDVGAWIQTFAGGAISGPGSLSKFGSSTLVLDNSSATWTGGTMIRNGTLQLGRNGSYGLLPGTLANPSSIVISAGATLRFNRGSDKSFFDIISGAGNVTIANSPNATVRLVSDNTYTGRTTISSGTLMIGQGNQGDPGSIVSSVTNRATLVFNRVEDLTYAGAISGPGELIKQAPGKLMLTGTHTHTGPTTIRAGTLLVNGLIGNSAVTVSNGTLGGNGIILGPVTVRAQGRLSPGTSIGTLTISNSLNLAGVTLMELDTAGIRTSDLVRGLSTVTYGGTLVLSNLAGAITATSTFKLFGANIYRGAFAALTPVSPGPGLAWNTNTLTSDGTLRVVSTAPVALNSALSGGVLALSWPADHTGWRLQSQTNPVSIGLGTNWFNIPNSFTTNQVTFPQHPIAPCVFYRLVYP